MALFHEKISRIFEKNKFLRKRLLLTQRETFEDSPEKKLTKSWTSIAQLKKKKLLRTNFSKKIKLFFRHRDCSVHRRAENLHQRTETISLSFPKSQKHLFCGKIYSDVFFGDIENIFVKDAKNLVKRQKFFAESPSFFQECLKMMIDWTLQKKFFGRKKCTRHVKSNFDEIALIVC